MPLFKTPAMLGMHPALALSGHSIVQQPQRFFVKSMDERKAEKDAQAFRDDIEYFLSKEKFNMFDFHERVLVSS